MKNKKSTSAFKTFSNTVKANKKNALGVLDTVKNHIKELPNLPWKKLPLKAYALIIILFLIMLAFMYLAIFVL